MSTVAIEIPDEVMCSLDDSPAELVEQIRLASAIHWYKAGKISKNAASSLAGLKPEMFMKATNDSQHGYGYRRINNETEEERVAAIHKALKNLHESGAFSDIDDPVEWQREIRKDRPLPGRE